MQTPSREVLDDQPGDVAVGLPGGRVVKGCCPAHVGARNRAQRRDADRRCPAVRAARRHR